MSDRRISFAIYDTTSYQCLLPVAEAVSERAKVQFHYFDNLLRTSKKELPHPDSFKTVDASEYIWNPISKRINQIERQQPIFSILFQRIIEDNISPRLSYNIDQYLQDTNPDVFVTAHDILPFIKHIIAESDFFDFKSLVIQHGINRPLLEDPSEVPGVPNLLTPSTNPQLKLFEYIKRKFGYRYGAFIFCNPYVDVMLTLGNFFTSRIESLRCSYPCFGKSDVETIGSTEMNPNTIRRYNPSIENALFLSQWQYEIGEWTQSQQRKICDTLSKFREKTDIPLTVRPHPKESSRKIDTFFKNFSISEESCLERDIENHDLIITVDSTALLEAVIQGKVPAVLHPPWKQVQFPPFSNEHILQISEDTKSVRSDAQERSKRTQQRYLDEFCYVPSTDESSDADSPVEAVSNKILSLATHK